jgi:DNA-binding LacI/PurR family transcriptional regulator
MATRRETRSRLDRLSRDLHELRRRATGPGEPLPPVRALAETYGVSVTLVRRELSRLQELGIIHSVPRVGTFVGPPAPDGEQVFVLVAAPGIHFSLVREAFETRASQLGRVPLVMPADALSQWHARDDAPRVAGLFEFTEIVDVHGDELFPDIPRVRYGDTPEPGSHLITFDDVGAAKDATEHLVGLGHRHIGYVGVHTSSGSSHFRWSGRRLQGYLAVVEARLGSAPAVFLPRIEAERLSPTYYDDPEAVVAAIEATPRLTALVVSTQQAWLNLLDAARPDSRLHELAIVTFDYETLDERSGLLSTMRLPWQRVGELAAELLHSGEPPSEHTIGMELVPRLSSLRPASPFGLWARSATIPAAPR